jgi:tetratricopeptide (TPR) repeat protein
MFKLKKLFSLFLILISQNLWALDFTPTNSEWLIWSEMCQARYVVSMSGKKSEYQNKISQETVSKWKNQIGADAWYGLHHYCAGLHKQKRGDIGGAINEFMFSYTHKMPETHFLHAQIGAHLSNAYIELENYKEATLFAALTIKKHPVNESGYIIKALIERKEQKIDKAISTLKLGDIMTKNKSAEINYHLGLAYLKIKELELAKKHAITAETLGYPLFGLKKKLKILKAW